MDPSGASLCLHTHDSIEEFDANDHTSQEVLNAPTPNGEVTKSEGPDCGLQPSKADFREEKAEETRGDIKDSWGWRKVVGNFTPS